MTNVKLLFEVRFYKFIYLQGRYPEHIVCAMRCYCTVNWIWKKICVSKLLSLFTENWQREVKIHHISFLSQVMKWQKVNNDQNVSGKGQRTNSLLLLNPPIESKHIFIVIPCLLLCSRIHRWQMMETQNERKLTRKRHKSWIGKIQ